MALFSRWRAERERRRKATAFVVALSREPEEDDAQWLARTAARGDVDHARWELRYARRALGLLTAQRDALDDRTAASVARALDDAFAHDPNIAQAMRPIAERQFNARLSAYRDVLNVRASAAGHRLGQTLFAFAGGSFRDVDANVVRASAVLTAYLAEASSALRDVYGAAAIPEHVAPSALVNR
jgi:hypothetical protein